MTRKANDYLVKGILVEVSENEDKERVIKEYAEQLINTEKSEEKENG